jgi:hypothetical protein
MAGSRKWFKYRAGDGNDYAVQLDESNGEVADFADYADADDLPLLPRGHTMRYVNVERNGASRKIWVGTPGSGLVTGSTISLLLSAFGVGDFLAATAWKVLNFVSEKVARKPIATDTGILDGDAT